MPSKLFGSKTARRPHLVSGTGGVAGEVADLRQDVEGSFARLENQGGYFRTDEFTNPATADVDAFKTSFATSGSVQSISGAALNGVVGVTEMVPPRNPTVTSSSHAHVTAVAVVFTGRVRNSAGDLVSRTVTVNTTNGGGATDAGAEALSIIDSVSIPAMGGASGSLQLGFGVSIGLGAKVKSRAGLIRALREVASGAVVTTGTFTNPSGAPVSLYTPSAAPNAANDYAVTFEVDPA
jgi:hypothetical protein